MAVGRGPPLRCRRPRDRPARAPAASARLPAARRGGFASPSRRRRSVPLARDRGRRGRIAGGRGARRVPLRGGPRDGLRLSRRNPLRVHPFRLALRGARLLRRAGSCRRLRGGGPVPLGDRPEVRRLRGGRTRRHGRGGGPAPPGSGRTRAPRTLGRHRLRAHRPARPGHDPRGPVRRRCALRPRVAARGPGLRRVRSVSGSRSSSRPPT